MGPRENLLSKFEEEKNYSKWFQGSFVKFLGGEGVPKVYSRKDLQASYSHGLRARGPQSTLDPLFGRVSRMLEDVGEIIFSPKTHFAQEGGRAQ